jgi:hypothetical protein
MGILSDFVVADPSEAKVVAGAGDRRRWPVLQSNGFTVLEVAWLHFLITGEDADAPASPPKVVQNPFTKREQVVSALVQYSDFPCLADTGETWLHQLPNGLVDELAKATDLPLIADRWASCEELRGAKPEILAGILMDLQRLARLARSSKKALLLWTSL